jgi:uncharacterized protein YdeI (YjbR/CyaY-like superfamily)
MPIDHTAPIRFFATPAAFRKWLATNHEKASELWVGYYKKGTGKPSITWPESVDEALCVGWIDGIRKSIDEDSYKIRFTPRKATSIWSSVNQKRMNELLADGRVLQAGRAAWERRTAVKSSTYAYENRASSAFTPEMEKTFRAAKKAWAFFAEQPPGYRSQMTWWVISAKQDATRERRLAHLIKHSANGERIRTMPPAKPKR